MGGSEPRYKADTKPKNKKRPQEVSLPAAQLMRLKRTHNSQDASERRKFSALVSFFGYNKHITKFCRKRNALKSPTLPRRSRGAVQPWLPAAALVLIIVAVLARMLFYTPPAVKDGSLAPDILLSNPGEPPVHLSDKKGKVVLLDFWATWCGPCKMSMPHLSRIYENYKSDGVEVYGISTDFPDKRKLVPAVAKSLNVTYPMIFAIDQPGIQQMYRTESLPTLVIVNKKGEVARYLSGYDPSVDLDAIIAALQKEG